MWNIIKRLRAEGLRETKHIQWFHVGDAFKGMGVKVIGTCCSMLLFQRWIKPSKYLLGFMNMEPEIPGLGRLEGNYAKVSARAPQALSEAIKAGKAKPLSELLPKAAKLVGGFADGHSVAASGVVPRGAEEELVKKLEGLMGK